MFELSIEVNMPTLLCVLIIGVILIIAMILGFLAYTGHDKRRFDSINNFISRHSPNYETYSENMDDYKRNVEKSGVNNEKKINGKIKIFFTSFLSLLKKIKK